MNSEQSQTQEPQFSPIVMEMIERSQKAAQALETMLNAFGATSEEIAAMTSTFNYSSLLSTFASEYGEEKANEIITEALNVAAKIRKDMLDRKVSSMIATTALAYLQMDLSYYQLANIFEVDDEKIRKGIAKAFFAIDPKARFTAEYSAEELAMEDSEDGNE